MAVAIEELTPEAQAIAARLHPGVKAYLEAKAGRAAAAQAEKATAQRAKAEARQVARRSASRSDSGGSGTDASGRLQRIARFEGHLDRITPGRGLSRSAAPGRLVSALFLGVLALVVISQVLNQPFSFGLPGGAKVGDLSKTPYRPLYAGQQGKGIGPSLGSTVGPKL